jgi:hypothetical protein
MKKFTTLITLLSIIIIGISVLGCNPLQFDIDVEIPEQIVEGSGWPIDEGIFAPDLSLEISQAIEEQETGPIDTIFIKSFTLSITSTEIDGTEDVDNFDFLSSVSVTIESTKTDTTLEPKKIAEIQSVPDGQTELDFTVYDDINLQPYVDEGFIINSNVDGSQPTDNVSFDGLSVYTVQPIG